MQFLREDAGKAVLAIAKRIGDELTAGKRVLWLTSGGGNVGLQVAVMQQLHERCKNRLDGLAIMPMDERYGPQGHKDSNTQQLREAGFDPGKATWVDVLLHNVPFDQTIDFYNDVAATALANASVIVGQFGMGADAHVAGILPGSPAVEVDDATVTGYEWDDYTRMTLTPKVLTGVTVAYVPVYGDNKKTALERLLKNKAPLSGLPAKLLYEIPEVYVYNDQLETTESEG
ncbi:MAG TPA: 6-phosphogluconolactonase [Candidatus Saccharimonadales bacterium]|nr:6-phosphogluconolactonase [Candidatus Saccharimonadales bacterium]